MTYRHLRADCLYTVEYGKPLPLTFLEPCQDAVICSLTSCADGKQLSYLLQLHLHSGEQSTLALPHLNAEQSPLQLHLISSLHAADTSGSVTHTGAHDSCSLVQP